MIVQVNAMRGGGRSLLHYSVLNDYMMLEVVREDFFVRRCQAKCTSILHHSISMSQLKSAHRSHGGNRDALLVPQSEHITLRRSTQNFRFIFLPQRLAF